MGITATFKLIKPQAIGFAIAAIVSMYGCDPIKEPSSENVETVYQFDLDSIKKRGTLVALIDNSTTSYFTYKGQPLGFEYELLKRYADSENLNLEVKVIYQLDSITEILLRGEGDLVAANLTITKERTEKLAFSSPILTTRQVLIQRRGDSNFVRNIGDLAGKTIHVRAKSSFYNRLKNLENELGQEINIIGLSDTNSGKGFNKTIQLIDQVAKGEIDFTVADENIAKVEQKFRPNLDISVAISLDQNIAWALRLPDTALKASINNWLAYEQKRNDFHTIYTKYFKARTKLKKKIESDYSSVKGGISPYDELIKKYAHKLGWDWRLLASQVYQESKFDPNAKSWTGASGLLQLMPKTAKAQGVDSLNMNDPESNLSAGVDYLKWLDGCWAKTIPDSVERIKFVLASFNVGLGHIMDARNLSAKYNANPTVWDKNVAEYILLKSERKYYSDQVCKHGYCRGNEPYRYVQEIFERYRHYENLIEVE